MASASDMDKAQITTHHEGALAKVHDQRSPRGAQEEPKRSPKGTQEEPKEEHKRSPRGAQVEPKRNPNLGSSWVPLGLLLGFSWAPLGFLLGSTWAPLGLLLGSSATHQVVDNLHGTLVLTGDLNQVSHASQVGK